MRAMTVLAVVTIAAWHSTALGQETSDCSPPALQRVHRLPSSGIAVTTVTPLPAVTGPQVRSYPLVATPAPVTTGRYYAYRPIISISPKLTNYHVGRGILGQPKIYVPGQPVRNFFRYLSP